MAAHPDHLHRYQQSKYHRRRRSAAGRRVRDSRLQPRRVVGLLHDPGACLARRHAVAMQVVCKERAEVGAFLGLGVVGHGYAAGQPQVDGR